MPKTLLRLTLLAASLLACASPANPPPPDNKPNAPVGPTAGPVDRLGAYSAGQARAILTGTATPTVLVGLSGAPLDPQWLGGPPANEKGFFIPSGLLVADAATGHARVLGTADGLPEVSYDDGTKDWGHGPAPMFALTWLTPDHAFAAASGHLVVRGEVDANGTWTFRSTAVRHPDQDHDAFVGAIAAAGGELFAGTDQGVAVLDPATLAVKHWIDFEASTMGGVAVSGLGAATVDGAPAVIALFGAPGRDARKVAVLRPGEETATTFLVPFGEGALSIAGTPDFTAIGVVEADGRGAIRQIVRTPDDYLDLVPFISADELAASTQGAVVPHRLVWDATRSELLVGGELRAAGGSGFVTVAIALDESAHGRAKDALDRADPYTKLLPKQVDALAVDKTGRWYLAGRSLCSEHKLGVVGVQRLEQDGSAWRLVRPWVSGVRTIANGPDGQTWLGLRDEVPGLVCDGATVQTGACRLRADGACELYTPFVNADLSTWTPAPAVSRYAFDDAHQGFALATSGDGLFLRRGQTTRAIAAATDLNLQRGLNAAAFGTDGSLWLASSTEWNYEPGLDNDKVNARSPHGLGWLALGDDATITAKKRYVRAASDNVPNDDVPGLPSNHVWDVLPLDGTRHALVALGVERGPMTYDHLLAAPDEHHLAGGLAIVDDAQVHAIAAPAGTTFGDVVALARDGAGHVWALDAQAGVFTVDSVQGTTALFAAPAWEAPVRATSLAVDDAGHVAVGTTAGAWVYGANGGVTKLFGAEHGATWSATFLGKGDLAFGTDAGLVRVTLDGATAKAFPGTVGARELWELSWGCHGTAGCACTPDRPCTSDTVCEFPESSLTGNCAAPDPCTANPAGAGCTCHADEDCGGGLSCACALGGACTCEDANACLGHCSCAGDGVVDGCPAGYTCESGFAGPSCVPAGPPACANDCTCTGLGTAGGCPTGYACQSGFAGQSCVEAGPGPGPGPGLHCADDCSCHGPNTTADGCPMGQSCGEGIHGPTCG